MLLNRWPTWIERSGSTASGHRSKEAAFRHPALLALQGLDHQDALDGLVKLLDEASYETRYGAMCTIRRRSDGNSVLKSKNTTAGFRFYEVASSATPFIAVSLFETAEIVCFGNCQDIQISDFLLGPGGIVVRRDEANANRLRVSRFVLATAIDEPRYRRQSRASSLASAP